MRKWAAALGVAAAGVATVALLAAATASAQKVVKCTVNGNTGATSCKTVCRQVLENGNSVDYDEGTSVTVNHPDGTSETIKCVNGQWVHASRFLGNSGKLWAIGALGVGAIEGTIVAIDCPPPPTNTIALPPPSSCPRQLIGTVIGPPGQIADAVVTDVS